MENPNQQSNQPSRALISTLLVSVLLAFLLGATLAEAKPKGKGNKASVLTPPKGKVFAGISDTGQTSDFEEYSQATGAHPAVMQSFEPFGSIPREAIRRWEDTRTRGMISLSTAECWGCKPRFTAREIAQGEGDNYIVSLASALADRVKPTYIRLFPEMNGHWNPYSAFGENGKPRGEEHSTANFKRAWKRFVLIVRGGKRAMISKKLRKLGLPKLRTAPKRIRKPKVAFAWVPQAFGSPNVPGNAAHRYFPGYRYVDWVGADIYGKFPSLSGVEALYDRYRKRPFMIGEWSPWNADQPGFTKSLFRWMKKNKRAKMAVYYQGFGEGKDNDFEVGDYPRSTRTLKKRLNSRRIAAFAPEEKPGGKNKKGKKGKGKKGKGKRGGGKRR